MIIYFVSGMREDYFVKSFDASTTIPEDLENLKTTKNDIESLQDILGATYQNADYTT